MKPWIKQYKLEKKKATKRYEVDANAHSFKKAPKENKTKFTTTENAIPTI